MRINGLLNSLPRLQTASGPSSPATTPSKRNRRPTMPSPTANNLLQQPGFLGALARFWQKSYASDYVVLIALLVLEILVHLFQIEPFHRLFHVDDLRISYPHAEHERVPPVWLLIYAVAVPLVVLAAWAAVVRPRPQKAHVTFLGLLLSLFVTAFVTEIIKNAVGRTRPDLLARCKPHDGLEPHKLYGVDVCTETSHHVLHDGWRSFPSGHSSTAFSGLAYLSLFLASQLHALHPHTPLPLAVLPLLPLMGALLIAISRTEDYRHDVWDVTAGSVLGCVFALAAYRRYYPSLWARNCEEPFEYRDETTRAGGGYARAGKDEEAVAAAAHIVGGIDSEDEDERAEGSGTRSEHVR